MKRKIIQITSMAAPGTDQHPIFINVVALCDDGSVWSGEWSCGQFTWTRLLDIPEVG